jgi:hypothetical protein
MIASSMIAEVLMLQRALEVRQGRRLSALSAAFGCQLLASFRLDVGLRGLVDQAEADHQFWLACSWSSAADSTTNAGLAH